MTQVETMATPAVHRDRTGVASFTAGIRGEVLQPSHAGYDEARRIWNGMIDRRPALIVRCAGKADVITCVEYARGEGLPLAVRGGGQDVAGSRSATAAL